MRIKQRAVLFQRSLFRNIFCSRYRILLGIFHMSQICMLELLLLAEKLHFGQKLIFHLFDRFLEFHSFSDSFFRNTSHTRWNSSVNSVLTLIIAFRIITSYTFQNSSPVQILTPCYYTMGGTLKLWVSAFFQLKQQLGKQWRSCFLLTSGSRWTFASLFSYHKNKILNSSPLLHQLASFFFFSSSAL